MERTEKTGNTSNEIQKKEPKLVGRKAELEGDGKIIYRCIFRVILRAEC